MVSARLDVAPERGQQFDDAETAANKQIHRDAGLLGAVFQVLHACNNEKGTLYTKNEITYCFVL
ncbi:hypothetical protein DPMN_108317 [Dreissena polymorpha]|uniref:Uncharacterized protein n=1 Tax=Dreissena polymorpha TaxID=45954 RepID=A0A9D4K8M1_DREPO|nr:hypothetical protein DPMN_108317 [Dreissena polymorpha]